ncbi:MAG: hypothetical protein ACI89L_002240 [Phycisphaerales bacterium]|jgi:hypothetical protein
MHATRSRPILALPPTPLLTLAPTLVLLALIGSLLVGCGGHPRASQSRPGFADTLPSAFGLSLTVIQEDAAEPNPLHQPARYVLDPDGWLRAGTGPGATRNTLPPQVRRLTHQQRQTLWDQTRASGLLEPDCPVRIPSGDGPIPDRARPLLLITASTDRGRFSAAVALESVPGEAYAPMLGRLREWAWISE